MNQLSSSTDTIVILLIPLRPLLSTKITFCCGQQAFTKAKEHLTEVPTFAYFSLNQPARLCTDASRHGLSFILQQQQIGMVFGASRLLFSHSSRVHYVVIELDLLAVAWRVMKCNMFLCGLQHFQVITDHSPLLPILNSPHLDEIDNQRLQCLRTRFMAYSFTAIWCKGCTNVAPDALSLYPIREPIQNDAQAVCMWGELNCSHIWDKIPAVRQHSRERTTPRPVTASRPGWRASAIERHHHTYVPKP